ncbi:YgaP family membrane protein [Flavimaricola marinus]|uniref:Inner membrane protein YgaP-like transmembrane domain-containing protein n=1 Tax=Flavimaricola marinus TaxID=1819565 RepID=A0A238LDB4_9RHOB|nr:DUF2892 domain-containing protein [Flavimaricola marinus]SMY07543.1 hypothetical protein LOM8899_01679 [Flavimaricola marinus]
MAINVGTLDRAIRIVVGVVLIGAPFLSGLAVFDAGWATVASIIVGLVMLATATMRFCPLYTLFGIQTCKVS